MHVLSKDLYYPGHECKPRYCERDVGGDDNWRFKTSPCRNYLMTTIDALSPRSFISTSDKPRQHIYSL
jgi:hypothetical protein